MIDPARLRRCYAMVREHLLAERNDRGYWEGELSASALATATAVMALEMVRRDPASGGREPPVGLAARSDSECDETAPRGTVEHSRESSGGSSPTGGSRPPLAGLIAGGLAWLAAHQNPDGGWGDTTKSLSNISTSMLARAVFRATGTEEQYRDVVDRAVAYVDRIGGIDAVLKRYGKDKTFSIPILTHCALAGLVEWRRVIPLPFELACIPARFYKTVRLPVVSYALPALIAIGQVRHHHRKPWNPLVRSIRNLARRPSLRVLERIQPTNGGFLEATPLTSFVTMSLAGMGLADHPVPRKGVEFIVGSVREDGSWPIDTNLATWVTTLSINALGPDLPADARPALRDWLLGQQYKEVHPYTNADPGGWAWTDLPGGVPDGDDTPGAMLALFELAPASGGREPPVRVESPTDAPTLNAGDPPASQRDMRSGTSEAESPGHPNRGLTPPARRAVEDAARWLVSLQNRDGGFPTFCRGWGTLPFDRSSADITAHCLRAMMCQLPFGIDAWIWDAATSQRFCPREFWFDLADAASNGRADRLQYDILVRLFKAFRYLDRTQRPDGSWYPLWFGNQFDPEEENPTYGTAKVLAAYRDCETGRIGTEPARRGLEWLRANQNDDGGWGGRRGIVSSVEETALATELLVSVEPEGEAAKRGVAWILDRVDGSRVESRESRAGGRRQGVGLDSSILDPPSSIPDSESTLDPRPSTLDLPPTPIGFYFAKLWYFERLYPIAFTVGALRRAVAAYAPTRET